MFFLSCTKNNEGEVIENIDDAITEEPIIDAIVMGTVSLKPFLKDVIQAKTGKALTLEKILINLDIRIYSIEDDNKEVLRDNYRDLPELIELPAGNYSYAMYTRDYTNTGVPIPNYGVVGSFATAAGSNTNLDAEIRLLDLAVTINFSTTFRANYPGIEAYVIVHDYFDGQPDSETTWNLIDSGDTNYFPMDYIQTFTQVSSTADLTVEISATDEVTGDEILVFKTYSGVSSNQHYNITVEYSNPEASTASLSITLGDEEIINDTIPFPFN